MGEGEGEGGGGQKEFVPPPLYPLPQGRGGFWGVLKKS